jgi:hypothetical protein
MPKGASKIKDMVINEGQVDKVVYFSFVYKPFDGQIKRL